MFMRFTPEQKQYMRANYHNTCSKTIAQHLGLRRVQVYKLAYDLGLNKEVVEVPEQIEAKRERNLQRWRNHHYQTHASKIAEAVLVEQQQQQTQRRIKNMLVISAARTDVLTYATHTGISLLQD